MPISNEYRQLILEKISKLSKNQRKVAEYLIEHPQEMALSSITDIAKKANVAVATVTRMAKALGYNKYLEMKAELLGYLRKHLTPVERFQIETDLSLEKDDILVTMAQAEVDNINKLLNLLDREAFNKAVDLITSSHHIYSMGLGISTFISQITAYLLNRITFKASALSHGSVSFIEQIIPMNERDVILTFSFPPYSSGTIEAAKFARSRNINIISITDKMTAPIVQYSNITLQAKTDNRIFANSLSAVFVLIYSLATEVALKDLKKTRQALSKLAHARSEFSELFDSDYIQTNNKFY